MKILVAKEEGKNRWLLLPNGRSDYENAAKKLVLERIISGVYGDDCADAEIAVKNSKAYQFLYARRENEGEKFMIVDAEEI